MGYYLTDQENLIWQRICDAYDHGWMEWLGYMQLPENRNYLCQPWMKLTEEETDLLDKIHEKIHPGWYCVDSLGCDQINAIMFDNLKKKVRYSKIFNLLHNLF